MFGVSAGILWLIVFVIVVVIVGAVMLARGPKPWSDQSAEDDHSGGGPTGTEYPPGSRPAGPGAESMDPAEDGEITPGPAADDDPLNPSD